MAIVPSIARPRNLSTSVAVDAFHADKGAMPPREQAEALAEMGQWVRPVTTGDVGAALSDVVARVNSANQTAITLDTRKGAVILREYGAKLYKGDAAGAVIFLAGVKPRNGSLAMFLAMSEDEGDSRDSIADAYFAASEEIEDLDLQNPRVWEDAEHGIEETEDVLRLAEDMPEDYFAEAE